MAQSTMPQAGLRPYIPADAALLAEIFRASIHDLAGEDYSDGQQEAWASAADDLEAFARKLAQSLTLVATMGGSPVGFITLKDKDVVDLLYIHPAVARGGVATMLYQALEKLARGRGASQLTVDASDTARAFFEKQGFEAQRRNTVIRGDEWLGNTTMRKVFSAGGTL